MCQIVVVRSKSLRRLQSGTMRNSGGDGVEIGIISPALIDHQICPMTLDFSFLVLHLQG